MSRIKLYIKLMRPKHYLKNGLIFLPLFFKNYLFNWDLSCKSLLGFFAFSMMASAIYIINDINDREADKKNEAKKDRPLASGAVQVHEAVILSFVLGIVSILATWYLGAGMGWLLGYFVLNLAYSVKLKHVPIVDVSVLAAGYFIRLGYGASITGVELSFWICMTAITFSLYMGLGKRRNELNKLDNDAHTARSVLQYYNTAFLDKNMYVSLSLAICFYALWSGDASVIADLGTELQIWTVPIVIILAMRYSLDIEKGESGDPMEVIMNDKWLICMGIVYVIVLFLILYVF